jgi:hypothetical protein
VAYRHISSSFESITTINNNNAETILSVDASKGGDVFIPRLHNTIVIVYKKAYGLFENVAKLKYLETVATNQN